NCPCGLCHRSRDHFSDAGQRHAFLLIFCTGTTLSFCNIRLLGVVNHQIIIPCIFSDGRCREHLTFRLLRFPHRFRNIRRRFFRFFTFCKLPDILFGHFAVCSFRRDEFPVDTEFFCELFHSRRRFCITFRWFFLFHRTLLFSLCTFFC